MRTRYQTGARDLIRQHMPRKGFVHVQTLEDKTGLSKAVIYYQINKMNDVQRIKIGLTKHKYFINQRIDKWIWQKICRYARQARMKLRNHTALLKKKQEQDQVKQSIEAESTPIS